MFRFGVFALALLVAACATPPSRPQTIQIIDIMQGSRTVTPDWAAIDAQPLGSRGNPVRAELPPGQQAYLRRLVCADGRSPTFGRIGNYGMGPFGGVIDGYAVECGGVRQTVFMDMYHRGHVETRAVPGFTIRNPQGTP